MNSIYALRLALKSTAGELQPEVIKTLWQAGCEQRIDMGDPEELYEKSFSKEEKRVFVKVKFHTAREVEHYQHDVLNRMINKQVSLIALPSSNNKLTTSFEDYKDHPFSWWEKKGLKVRIGTDNYITLNTNYIQELLILLFTGSENLNA